MRVLAVCRFIEETFIRFGKAEADMLGGGGMPLALGPVSHPGFCSIPNMCGM